MALALDIIATSTGIINFAHASAIMVGAMVAYWSFTIWHLPFAVAVIMGIGASILLNIIIYFACLRGLGNLKKDIGWIITLFGGAIIIENLARMIYGMQVNNFPFLFNGLRINFLGANIYLHEIIMIVVAAAIGVAYQTMATKTKLGRALRAVSVMPDTAALMGINSRSMILFAFALSGAVAAITGCLVAPYTYVSFVMTGSIGLKGYAAALIGGFGNTKGAFVGGITLGLIEQLITVLGAPPAFLNSFSFIVMILVVVFLPGGVINAKIFRRKPKAKEV
jgi:branched-chain amino acid transport system permease protein